MTIPLFSISISATGVGATISDAKAIASQELLSQISVTVSSKQRVMQSVSANEKTELFFEDIQLRSDLNLIGLQYQIVEEKKRFVVIASISEDTLPLYLEKLASVKNNIEEIENRLEEQSSVEVKKVYLLKLIGFYKEYEAYSTIAKILDEKAVVPKLSRTKAGAELDYLNLLIAESDLLTSTLTNLNQNAISPKDHMATVEAQNKIQLIAQQLEMNQRERERIKQEQAKQREYFFASVDIAIQESAQRMSQLADTINEQSGNGRISEEPLEYIRTIEEIKQRYLEIKTTILNEYDLLAIGIRNRYAQEIRIIEDSSYRIGEIVNGLPTDWAVKLRNDQISQKNLEMQMELESVMNTLEDSVSSKMYDLQTAIEYSNRSLEAKTFIIDSSLDNVVYKIGSYDGLERGWPVAIQFTILGADFSHDLYLPYSKITSSPLPKLSVETDKDMQAYHDYLNNVELYETFIKTTDNPLIIDISYSISMLDKPSAYIITPRSYSIKRADTGQNFFSQSIENAVLYSKEFSFQPANSLPFSYDASYAREMQEVTEKLKRIAKQENTKKILDAQLAESKMYYRSGIGLSVGYGLYEYEYTDYSFYSSWESTELVLDFPISFSAFMTPVNYLYIGLGLDAHILLDFEETYPSYIGIAPILGFVYPFPTERDTNFWKPFVELRFVASAVGLESVLCLGLSYDEIGLGFGGEMALRLHTSGPLQGMVSMLYGITF